MCALGCGGAPTDKAKGSAAWAQARVISHAVKRYVVEHDGIYPRNLDQLLQKDDDGNGPYLEGVDSLKDPWGQTYKYDPGGAINVEHGTLGSTPPDVYTIHPKGGRLIGNWSPNAPPMWKK